MTEKIRFLNNHIMVCPVCFKRKCKHGSAKIEIDESMEDILRILNNKNYKTLYHCGGHVYDGFIQIYIMFTSFANFGYNIGIDVGNGWQYDTKKNVLEYFIDNKRCRSMPVETRVKILESKHKELLDWANSLPTIEIPKIYSFASDWEEF